VYKATQQVADRYSTSIRTLFVLDRPTRPQSVGLLDKEKQLGCLYHSILLNLCTGTGFTVQYFSSLPVGDLLPEMTGLTHIVYLISVVGL